MLIVASRVDVAEDGKRLRAIKDLAAQRNLEFYGISSVTGEGLEQFKLGVARMLQALRATEPRTPVEESFMESPFDRDTNSAPAAERDYE
jgi:GTPase involved in cell partitioning and DNA repair